MTMSKAPICHCNETFLNLYPLRFQYKGAWQNVNSYWTPSGFYVVERNTVMQSLQNGSCHGWVITVRPKPG